MRGGLVGQAEEACVQEKDRYLVDPPDKRPCPPTCPSDPTSGEPANDPNDVNK